MPGAACGHDGVGRGMAPMKYVESMRVFDCQGERLVGIVAIPEFPRATGVVVVVGGPQYRVGSHRQFVLLARYLAAEGVAVMRFDYRGMGDSSGHARSFDDVEADIAAAIDDMQAACPEVDRVALWGLCDGASAALTYWHSTRDERVAGMALLNPWVRSDASLAQTHLKHYYGQHLREREFWRRLVRGRVDVKGALLSFARNVRTAGSNPASATRNASFQERMAAGLRTFPGPALLVLSGRDLTAKEFLEHVQSNAAWDAALGRANLRRIDIAEADHTFSSADGRREIEALTLAWMSQSFAKAPN